jgi:hypothetical protein
MAVTLMIGDLTKVIIIKVKLDKLKEGDIL